MEVRGDRREHLERRLANYRRSLQSVAATNDRTLLTIRLTQAEAELRQLSPPAFAAKQSELSALIQIVASTDVVKT